MRDGFLRRFGRSAEVITCAPGRVNLIGDHTDYTGGFVLPMAIDRATVVAAARRDDAVRVFSAVLNEAADWQTGLHTRIDPSVLPAWARYVYGVSEVLRESGVAPPGADVLIAGDVPLGAGLASSAALEIAFGLAWLALAGRSLPPLDLAQACRRAENEYAGSPCGIMDQAISACGRRGYALRIDCRDLELTHVPLALGDARVVVVDTGVRHSIAAGQYASRRHDCEAALARIREVDADIRGLRDVQEERLERWSALSEVQRRRVRHVLRENRRVLDACNALQTGDLKAFGESMFASHVSLRNDFEVSCEELDAIVELAQRTPGVLGARMTGGGFGGCAVVLLGHEALGGLRETLERDYNPRHPQPLRILPVESADGACLLPST